MKIRYSNSDDISSIMSCIHQAQDYFKEQGIDQWQDGYPNEKRIYDDIAANHSYVLEDDKVIGTMYFAIDDDPCYKVIDGKWLTDETYAIIHRIVVDQNHKGQNLAALLLEYAVKECKDKNINSMRIDTHKDNLSMQRFLNKNNFILCGTIQLESRDFRLAFEKIIT